MLKRPTFYVAVIGVIAVVLLVLRLQEPQPPAPPLAEPSRAPYPSAIGARGIVESRDENVRIAPSLAGRVDKVFVKVGDKVKRGDPLLEIDPREAEAELRLREAQVQVLEARVLEAEVNLEDRKDQLERTSQLRKKNVASLDEAQRDIFAFQGANRQLERSKAELSQAKAELAKAKVNRDLHITSAPRDGTVLQVNIREGEYAQQNPSEPLMLLGNVDVMQLRADVDEDSAPRIRPGCEAVAFMKGTSSDPIPLRFVRIEPYVVPKRSLTGDSTERVDTRVLQVIFQFEQPKVPVYVGQQMDVFIEEPSSPDA